jgi:hypothetical protein
MESNLYAKAERVNSDLANIIKRMLDNGDVSEAEAELVWRAIAAGLSSVPYTPESRH